MKSARIARLRLLVMTRRYRPPMREVALSVEEIVGLYASRIERTTRRTKAQDRQLRRYFDATGREVKVLG
jgi:hypothetical protein